jgi:SAM-dependent methyltransferase
MQKREDDLVGDRSKRDMRYYAEVKDISYSATREFFESQGRLARPEAPETSTMYQGEDLARQRDLVERETVLPILKLKGDERVLDIGCGYGRWAKALCGHIAEYVGADFSAELLRLAKGLSLRNSRFINLPVQELTKDSLGEEKSFDVFICSGILMYLNDDDVTQLASAIVGMATDGARVYLREPMALEKRLTLDRYPSSELNQQYSAIYRTAAQCRELFGGKLVDGGFKLEIEKPLYPPSLCNRKETEQSIQLWVRTK